MQTPILHFTDTDSFITVSRPAQRNPATGNYMTDALGAVLTPLPESDLPEHHRWRLVKGTWVATADHRGREGFMPDGTPHKVGEWGPLPDGWTVEKPVIPPTLGETRTAKLAEINAGYSGAMDYVQAGYPLSEVLSWERQATQARELVQNPKAEAAFVRGLASAKNLSIEEMCARILANVEDWEPVAAMLTGARQVMEEAAHAAETVEELQAIKVTYRV